MKYGLNCLLYAPAFSNECLHVIPKAKEMGFDGVEIPLFNLDIIDVKETRRVLADNGMECTTCGILIPPANFISDDASERRKGVSSMRASIKMASKLGSGAYCGPFFSPVGHLVGRSRNQKEWDRCVKCLKQVAKTASDYGITVGIEPLNRFETYFLNITEDAVKLVKEVGSPRVKVHIDTFHAHIEEKDTPAAILAAGKHLCHVHANENDRGTPGSGQVNWKGVFKALKAVKYDGWMVIESFVPAIKEIAAAASIWRDLAPDADYIGREGLKFLKRGIARAR